jgi:hypothetical protein
MEIPPLKGECEHDECRVNSGDVHPSRLKASRRFGTLKERLFLQTLNSNSNQLRYLWPVLRKEVISITSVSLEK